MRKRLLCTLLVAVMCIGETMAVSAVTVSGNEAAQEEVVKEESAEIAADAAGNVIYPEGDVPTGLPYGKDYELSINVSPNTKYSVAVYNAGGSMEIYSTATSGDGTGNTVKEKITLGFSKLKVGDYVMKFWIGDLAAESTAQPQEFSINIRKSIQTENNENITSVEIANVPYTGKTVVPSITIKETINDVVYTLVSGKDFTYKLTSANKKELGTVSVEVTGIGDFTGTITGTFDITPAIPAITSVVSTNYNCVTVKWTKAAYADGYYIDRRTEDGKFVNVGKVTDESVLSFADSSAGLVAGQTYYYRVRAYAASTTDKGKEVVSRGNETGVAVKVVPGTPKLASISNASYNKIKLTWEPVEGAAGYVVYRIESNGTLKNVKTTKNTSYTIKKNITCGNTYRYTVKAYVLKTGTQTKIYSGYDTDGLKIKAKPAAPAMVSAKAVAHNKIQIKWKKVTKAYGYRIYRREYGNEDSKWKRVKTVKYGDTTSVYDTKAEVGVTYEYAVKAYTKINGKTIYSDYSENVKKVKAVPAKPTIALEQVGRCVNVKITNVEGADGYYVYRKQGSGSYKKIATIKANASDNKTVYSDKSISYAKTYRYYVKAFTYGEEKRIAGKASSKVKIVTG